jgi:hypothetical protein
MDTKMLVLNIPDSLAEKYSGSGYALAASKNGNLVDLVYLHDVLPDFDADGGIDREILNSPQLGPTLRYLQSLGLVHVGMCSSWEFCEL